MAAHQAPEDDDFMRHGKFPDVYPPSNAEEFDALVKEIDALMSELISKSEIVAASLRSAIANPRPGSKYANMVAPLRFDLKAKAWWIGRALAGAGAGAEAVQKSYRESRRRYYLLIESAQSTARARGRSWGD